MASQEMIERDDDLVEKALRRGVVHLPPEESNDQPARHLGEKEESAKNWLKGFSLSLNKKG